LVAAGIASHQTHPGPLNQQAIADRLGLTKGTVSRQLDNAVHAGLMSVQPAAHTRRENTVKLTSAGTDLVRRGDALFQQARETVLPHIAARDMTAVVRVLGSLNAALEQAIDHQPGDLPG
jgi:DNA-binding MarR family transcriptional regulator